MEKHYTILREPLEQEWRQFTLDIQNHALLQKLFKIPQFSDIELSVLFDFLYHQQFHSLNLDHRNTARTLFSLIEQLVVNVLKRWHTIPIQDYFPPSKGKKIHAWLTQTRNTFLQSYIEDLERLEHAVQSLAGMKQAPMYWSTLFLEVLPNAPEQLRQSAKEGKAIEDKRLIEKLQKLQKPQQFASEIASFANSDSIRSLRYEAYGGKQLFRNDDHINASSLKLIFNTDTYSENVQLIQLLLHQKELKEERKKETKRLQWMRSYLQKKAQAFQTFADSIETFPVFQNLQEKSEKTQGSIGKVKFYEAITDDNVLYFFDHILIFLLQRCGNLIAQDMNQHFQVIEQLSNIGSKNTLPPVRTNQQIAKAQTIIENSIRIIASNPLHAAALVDIDISIDDFLASHWDRLRNEKLFQHILSIPLAFHIPQSSRERHCYILGQSGSGKTELLKQFIHADIKAGHGVLVLDPHGDLAQQCLQFKVLQLPQHRNRLLYISPEFIQQGQLPHYNPFDYTPPQKLNTTHRNMLSVRALELSAAFKTIMRSDFTPNMELLLLNCIKLLLETPNVHLGDFMIMLYPEGPGATPYLRILNNHWDEDLKNYFTYLFPQQRLASAKTAIITRLSRALGNQFIKQMFCSPKSTFDLRQMLDNGSIIIVNAKQSQLSRDGSMVLGALLTAELSIMAMSRADKPVANRTPIFAYIDECHTFLTETIDILLSESRKYGVHLTMANQFLGQFEGLSRIKQSILANTAVKFCGSTSAQDRSAMEKELDCSLAQQQDLHKGRFACRVSPHKGIVVQVHSDFLPPINTNPYYATEDETQTIVEEQLHKYYRSSHNKILLDEPKRLNHPNQQSFKPNLGDL